MSNSEKSLERDQAGDKRITSRSDGTRTMDLLKTVAQQGDGKLEAMDRIARKSQRLANPE